MNVIEYLVIDDEKYTADKAVSAEIRRQQDLNQNVANEHDLKIIATLINRSMKESFEDMNAEMEYFMFLFKSFRIGGVLTSALENIFMPENVHFSHFPEFLSNSKFKIFTARGSYEFGTKDREVLDLLHEYCQSWGTCDDYNPYIHTDQE
jgi:hypothetical protein